MEPAAQVPATGRLWVSAESRVRFIEHRRLTKSNSLFRANPPLAGVYECVVQNTLGRTSVIYRLKVLPSFITTTDNAGESASGLKVNSTPPYNRSRKSVLDSLHPNDLTAWSTRLANGGKSLKSDGRADDPNKPDDTILSLRNVTIERLGQKITLRCYVDGTLAQPHFRVSWFLVLQANLCVCGWI